MKILVFGINYYPELTGIGKYTTEMCEWLASKGHTIQVITGMPYYPQWRIHKAYRGKLWHKEIINGVTVLRVPLYVPQNVTGKTRILQEFSFSCSSLFYWIPAFFKKYDCIISVCPPFHLGFQSLIHKYLRKTPVVYHIQDLQVDAARTLGLITSEFALKFLEKAENFILQRVSCVSSISPGMRDKILEKGVPQEKYMDLPNWVDIDEIFPLEVENSLRKEMGFKVDDKIVLYSGNLGEKQGLEVIIEIAEQLRTIHDLHFLFVGEGASKGRLMELASKKELLNVHFFPLQPYNKLSQLLAVADLHLVLQKKAAADLLFPSKLMSILSSGGVAIVTADPETTLYNLIKDYNIGILIPPEDTPALLHAIEKFISGNNEEIKKNARNYALDKLSITQILSAFEQNLVKLESNG